MKESLDEIMEKRKKELLSGRKRKNMLKDGKINRGKSYKDIAREFCNDALKVLKKDSYIYLSGRYIREFFCDPNAGSFRIECRKRGIRLIKSPNQEIYKVEKFNVVKRLLKND